MLMGTLKAMLTLAAGIASGLAADFIHDRMKKPRKRKPGKHVKRG